ncbi:MFS transporter [Nocardia alba]|uniref:Putative proline/betaine transporter n=1 Tax=Nocardia alba TaxID=225051 RepID=A0A4R1FUI7_9NOCA|nr:MFS transporter [Nocardia alba]TCJ97329.1 MHS family proline/betaine transporter-like MFS transporter [Nocardia alba]
MSKESKSVLHRAIGASAIGNAVEWFDYGVYAYLATYIARSLFPGDGESGVVYTLLGFAVSFLIRPVGGMIWGPLGDRIGRKRVLATTIILMAGSTLAVGLIPSFDMIGIGAPILLYALRMIQGLSAGGEYGGAATFMAEYAPDRKRGFYGSFLEVGTLAGFTLGNLVALLLVNVLDDASMDSWGWRIPFMIAGPLGLIGMYLRSRVEDTPVFREVESKDEIEQVSGVYRDLATKYLRPVLTLFGLVIALNVVNYSLLSYTPTYLGTTLGMEESDALLVPLIGQLAMLCVLPFLGALSDRIGRKPMWMFSCAAMMIAVVPVYHLIGSSLTGAIVGFAILGLLYAPQLATISATFPAMFPTIVRFAGVAIGYNVATSMFGGTAPVINEALISATGNNMVPAYYMFGACAVGLVSSFFLIETKGVSLRGTQVPGTPEAIEEQRELGEPVEVVPVK